MLDLSREEVQTYIIDAMSAMLSSARITYVKWDNNRGMHELEEPSKAHAYIIGLYHVLDVLTTRFPAVLWEGCASGGGRIDPGLLHYWCQSWTSDNTDGLDRLGIQFGTSLCYPASSMSGHISAVPSHQTRRTTPILFRAHVAMMCGGFGFELDPGNLSPSEQESVPSLIALSERINPLVIHGDMYRLARPDESNWPAAMYVSEDRRSAVVLAFQMQNRIHVVAPMLRLQGLDEEARYSVKGDEVDLELTGGALMSVGVSLVWGGDYQSRALWVKRV